MAPELDPLSINHDNMPYAIGVMLEKQGNMEDRMESLEGLIKAQGEKLDGYDKCFAVLKFSRCQVIPWVVQHKSYILGAIFLISAWYSSLDWINRWAQWAFFPPVGGTP